MAVLGDAADARGFALAGATTIRCRTREDVVRALAAMDPRTSLVVCSRTVAAMAPAEIEAFGRESGRPLVTVLPDTGAAA